MDYFPRGDGPLVSVLLPTRGRPDAFRQSVRSLFATAANPNSIEIVVRMDDDDATMEWLRMESVPVGRVLIGPRGRGYDDLHLMVNELAAAATGDWLLLWNDDAVMLQPEWDLDIDGGLDPRQRSRSFAGTPDVCLVQTGDANGRPTTIFPLVRRASVQRLGHFSLNAYNDAWVGYIFQKAGASVDCPEIRVRHNHRLGESVPEAQAPGRDSHAHLISELGMAAKDADVEVLKRMIQEHKG